MTRERHSIPPSEPGAPPPLERTLERRIHFHEVDPMNVMWFGNYCRLLDEAGAYLREMCGLSYEDFRRQGVMAPVKRMEIDYRLPLALDECVRITARMPWTDAMRIDTDFTIVKQDGRIAATAWMAQLFVTAKGMQVIYVEQPFIRRFREQWRKGVFATCP